MTDYRPAIGSTWVRRAHSGTAALLRVKELHADDTATLLVELNGRVGQTPDNHWPGIGSEVRWPCVGWKVFFDEVTP